MYCLSIIVSAVVCLSVHQCIPTGYGDSGSELGGYGGGAGAGYQEEHHEAKPYAFGYAVKDYKKGTDFNQHETSDGHNVHGQYTVQLPDGRTQIVSYKADWKNGYNADIKYVGEAHHPEIYATHDSGYGGLEHGSSYGGLEHGSSYGGGAGGAESYGLEHGAGGSSSNFQSLGSGGSHGNGYESAALQHDIGGGHGY